VVVGKCRFDTDAQQIPAAVHKGIPVCEFVGRSHLLPFDRSVYRKSPQVPTISVLSFFGGILSSSRVRQRSGHPYNRPSDRALQKAGSW
jgi:hypothetical protein